MLRSRYFLVSCSDIPNVVVRYEILFSFEENQLFNNTTANKYRPSHKCVFSFGVVETHGSKLVSRRVKVLKWFNKDKEEEKYTSVRK